MYHTSQLAIVYVGICCGPITSRFDVCHLGHNHDGINMCKHVCKFVLYISIILTKNNKDSDRHFDRVAAVYLYSDIVSPVSAARICLDYRAFPKFRLYLF